MKRGVHFAGQRSQNDAIGERGGFRERDGSRCLRQMDEHLHARRTQAVRVMVRSRLVMVVTFVGRAALMARVTEGRYGRFRLFLMMVEELPDGNEALPEEQRQNRPYQRPVKLHSVDTPL